MCITEKLPLSGKKVTKNEPWEIYRKNQLKLVLTLAYALPHDAGINEQVLEQLHNIIVNDYLV